VRFIDGDDSEIGERGVSNLNLIDATQLQVSFVQVNLSGGQKARGKCTHKFVYTLADHFFQSPLLVPSTLALPFFY
jgi:hypothetical protein